MERPCLLVALFDAGLFVLGRPGVFKGSKEVFPIAISLSVICEGAGTRDGETKSGVAAVDKGLCKLVARVRDDDHGAGISWQLLSTPGYAG